MNLEDKLTELRKQYRLAVGVDRVILKGRGLLLKWALEERAKRNDKIEDIFK